MKKVIVLILVAGAFLFVGLRFSTYSAARSGVATAPIQALGNFHVKTIKLDNEVIKRGTQEIGAPITDCVSAHCYRIRVTTGTIVIQDSASPLPTGHGLEAPASVDIPSGKYGLTIQAASNTVGAKAEGTYQMIPTPQP